MLNSTFITRENGGNEGGDYDIVSYLESKRGLLPLRICEAFGGYTRDLDLIWKETGQDCSFTRGGFKELHTISGDGVAIPSDVVKTYKRRHQEINENPIRTLADYSRPSHEGYQNTIELPEGNNVVPLRSDTIRAVNYAAGGRLGETSAEKAWSTNEELAQYEEEGWNDPISLEE
uniref:Zinc finger, CCHC-type n=1 Tax=Tanacetum cinerariifolium TaxID=118510 RepID=A0A6L2NJI5_TANCI|nr:zinc finger, CCHC-type [Tanacetum cinerariifolium]